MDKVEQRARELLREVVGYPPGVEVDTEDAIRAIIAALTQQPAAVGEDSDDTSEPCESGLPDCGSAVAWDQDGVGVCARCAKEIGWIGPTPPGDDAAGGGDV